MFNSCSIALAGSVNGPGYKWYPLEIDFHGPLADERDTAPNPFLDYRLDVTFTAPDGRHIAVPGFFDGDGQGGGSGSVWRVRFAPDATGEWQYRATLRAGDQVAIAAADSAGTAVSLDGAEGRFTITDQPGDAPGFLRLGRLEYIGEHYLKFRDGPFWIKGGTDSPENFLGYAGIEGTVDQGGIDNAFLHDYAAHVDDFRAGDPLFANPGTGVDSRGIIGALNYLSDQGVNSLYFLPMNLGGDGQDTYPFVGGDNTRFDKTHYDIGKLRQWHQVFTHAQQQSIALNIVLSETEIANERWLDNGQLGIERKLFFRELVARFAWIPAAKWNLGEENDFPVSELRKQADWLSTLDWSDKPITVHTQINNFRDYEQIVGDARFAATSIQYDPELAGGFVERWRERSAASGQPWVIDMDENTGGITAGNAATRRKQILYDVLFSGGNIEWYFGYHPLPLGGDVTAGNFRLREPVWTMTRIARQFMEDHLPFWRMAPDDGLLRGEPATHGGGEVLAAPGEVYAIYLPAAGGSPALDLRGQSGRYTLRWFNPVNGGFEGNERVLAGGDWQSLGAAPSRTNDDWVVLVRREGTGSDAVVAPGPVVEVALPIDRPIEQPGEPQPGGTPASESPPAEPQSETPAPSPPPPNRAPTWQYDAVATATRGTDYRLVVVAADEDGVAPVVRADNLPGGMRISVDDNGQVTLDWPVPAETPDNVPVTLTAIDVQDATLEVGLALIVSVVDAAPSSTDTDTTTASSSDTAETDDTATGDASAPGGQNLPPRIYGLRDRSVMVGERLNLVAMPFDPEGIVPNLRTTALPDGASFDDNGDGSRTLRWIPDPHQLGKHRLDVTAEDVVTGSETSQTVTLEVIDQTVATAPLFQDASDGIENHAPVFAALDHGPDGVDAPAGRLLSFSVRAVDPDGPVPALNILSPPAGASFDDNGDGSRQFRWTPSADQAGAHTLVFVATDAEDNAVRNQLSVYLTVTTVGN